MNTKKCAFTGHRPQSLPFGFRENDPRCTALKQALRSEIIHMIEDNGVTYFISGMALGVDTYAAEIVLDLKAVYPEIKLECAIPCKAQREKWSQNAQSRYLEIISNSDKPIILQREYTSDCMQKRNKYMVNEADYLIAVWNGRSSGTSTTVQYAKSLNRRVSIIHPETLKIDRI
ncbi:MAG: DUF1273 domain-containing protein [Clostridiales bacterium]|nr:DUF1273 domain-containing protein [Clostridiales bacterium]